MDSNNKEQFKVKTIIMLCMYRTGSSTIYEVFRKHPEVGNCISRNEDLFFEPNYWNVASYALKGKDEIFKKRIARKFPYIILPKIITKSVVFKIWNTILKIEGPVIFDRTPSYLGNRDAINLILDFKNRGNDVRILFLIRNPLDTITSQHELSIYKKRIYSIQNREQNYLDKILHIKEIRRKVDGLLLLRYEDIVYYPRINVSKILRYCALESQDLLWKHIKPMSVDRFWGSINHDVRKWNVCAEVLTVMDEHNYSHKKNKLMQLIIMTKMFFGNIQRHLFCFIKPKKHKNS